MQFGLLGDAGTKRRQIAQIRIRDCVSSSYIRHGGTKEAPCNSAFWRTLMRSVAR